MDSKTDIRRRKWQDLPVSSLPESPEEPQDSKHEGDPEKVEKVFPGLPPKWGPASPDEAACEKCGKSMAGPRGTTGRCLACFPLSREVIVQPNNTYKIVTRRERRHPSGRVHK